MKIKSLLPLFLLPFFLFAKEAPPKPKEQELFNKDDQGVIINGEFIYWNVQEGALDYAIRMKSAAWSQTESYAQGDFERAEFNWDPGYRLSIGYNRAENFWEALAEYTCLHVEGNNRVKMIPPADEGRFINGTFPHIFTDPIHHAKSHIHLHYKLFNLLANRVFHPHNNPHLRLRATAGITSVFVHQGWRVNYFDLSDNTTTIWNRWRYWGMGFRAGMGFDWFFGKDVYLSGKSSFALTMGHYHNHAKQTTSAAPRQGDDPSIPVRDARYNDYRMAFTTQFLIGPSYQKSFADWWRFEMFAGYELTIWTNLQEVYRSTAGSPSEAKETWLNTGLVALHGLTIRASFNF